MQNNATSEIFPLSCVELLQNFNKEELPRQGIKIQFPDIQNCDVYNITSPFHSEDLVVIAGRVEKREIFSDSHIIFFKETSGAWAPINNAPFLKLEDGFVTFIGGEIIFGGVEVYPNPTIEYTNGIGYRTVFYRGQNIQSLRKFAVGPDIMKDIRLSELENGRIAVFTRPSGGINGRGRIGYVELNSISDLNKQNILNAKIIEKQFAPSEWGGANELHKLGSNIIGVLGHIAYQDTVFKKHYYATSFIYDTENNTAGPIKIIAKRSNFPQGESKTPELEDVIFPGGLVRHNDGTASLYAGLSDAEAGVTTIKDPFI